MLRLVPVHDPADPRLVEVAGLTDAEARRRVDAAHGCFVAEGVYVLSAVVDAALPLRCVLVAEPRLHKVRPVLEKAAARRVLDVHVAPLDVLRAVVGFDMHRGVVASVERPPARDPSAVLAGAEVVALVEGGTDHENLGALFRNAAAFAVDAVLLDPTCADPLYRRAVRVSMGHVVRVPWARLVDWPADVEAVRAAGFTVAALSPAGEVALDDLVAARPARLAWLLGAEGPGLTRAALDAADVRVRIPMAPGVDSLNLATAGAIAFSRTAPDSF